MNSFFLSCKLPPNSEGSAEPCEAIGASLRTQVRIVFECFTHPYFSVSFTACPPFITPVPSKAGTNASLADSPCWT